MHLYTNIESTSVDMCLCMYSKYLHISRIYIFHVFRYVFQITCNNIHEDNIHEDGNMTFKVSILVLKRAQSNTELCVCVSSDIFIVISYICC